MTQLAGFARKNSSAVMNASTLKRKAMAIDGHRSTFVGKHV
ncbi:hypothetical protein [Altererythrobacter lutimaris]|nr:hypothetical protein [Altererythrobacter lutimaris]